ncbi:MAG: gamma-glutamylcyclotransferase family protein [Thermoanaerobaculia bacterium]|nr:gamma-glutamylcyclotransferase family protein [Thermoanaerobaculia bacterium]
MLYFAYGSNLLTRRLNSRAPSARRVTTGYVAGRRLAWDKVSVDGSGKCDAEATGDPADRIWGVVFEVPPGEMIELDRAEGPGYERTQVEVVTAEGPISGVTYVATRKDPELVPYRWYRDLAVAGAEEHGLPGEHVERMRSAAVVEDPVEERRHRMAELLARMVRRA